MGKDVGGNLSVESSRLESGTGPLVVELSVGALELNIRSANQETITVDYAGVEPKMKQGDGKLTLEGERIPWGSCIAFGETDAEGDLVLPAGKSMELEINAGAADIAADLSGIQLKRLEVDAGAADIHVLLPYVLGELKVEMDTGASDITIEVPRKAAIRLTADGALNSTNLDDLKLIRHNRYLASPDYDKAEARLAIDIDSAVTDLTIRRVKGGLFEF